MKLPSSLYSLLLLASTATVSFSRALPKVPLRTICHPRFSGLVQGIQSSTRTIVDGKLRLSSTLDPRYYDSPLQVVLTTEEADDPSSEWFVGGKPDAYTLSSALNPHFSCLHTEAQHVLSPADYAHHLFDISCEACDSFEDSASRCQIKSIGEMKCATINRKKGVLEWKECRDGGSLIRNQLFDFAPR